MSRLDSVIRRRQAQRACLDYAAGLVRALPGPVLELGFGQGCTYDHLRALLPGRVIFVFERARTDMWEWAIPAARWMRGDLSTTLCELRPRFDRHTALIHSDIGTGDPVRTRSLAAFLARTLPGLLRPDGIIVSDQELFGCRLRPLSMPRGIAPGRYFLYQR